MIKKEELSKIGQFTKPHGVKGEISLLTDYDISDISGELYMVCEMDDIPVPFFVDSCRFKSNKIVLVKFDSLDSEGEVKILSGKPAYIPSDMLPLLDEDSMGWDAIMGFMITDDGFGDIGVVKDVDDATVNILLVVDYKDTEVLIPAALITSVNQDEKALIVSLPEGFLDI